MISITKITIIKDKLVVDWTDAICEDVLGYMKATTKKNDATSHKEDKLNTAMLIKDEFIKYILFRKRLQAYETTREYLVKYDNIKLFLK